MTNFLKWIEYLATEPDYCFFEVELGYFGTTNFSNWFSQKKGKFDIQANTFNAHLNLKSFQPEILKAWYNKQAEFARDYQFTNKYCNFYQTAQHFLKLVKELKANGIDLEKHSTNIIVLKLANEGIKISTTRNTLKDEYFFTNEDLQKLNKLNKFNTLLNFLKGIENGTENK